MATISLKINIVKSNNIKTMQFEESMIVYDACRLIRERVPDAASGQPNEFGLFKPDEDPTKGRWLDQGRTLEYYHLKSGDMLQYRKKLRPLRVRTLDSSIKTLLVDDSQTVAELTRTVCARIGLSNPEEFSFTSDEETQEQTSRRLQQQHIRDHKKLDTLKKKLHTDDELNWLNPDKSLREQGIEETSMLTLRKKFFFSDQNVDRNDPVQLNLLYVQSRDAIVDGTHPCTREEAVQFAALQCQVQYGNHNEAKHKPGFLQLVEFVPREYTKIKGIEKNIFTEHRKLHNLSEINARFRYIQLCRSLRTYGVTFFLVKEKLRGRNKLVPRLLGITRESIMRVDENTKEVLKTWPLTTVRRWAASPNSFTLDFGDYSESFYSVQTTEGETISQLIAGYIDIIMQKKKPIHRDVPDDEDEPVISEQDVEPKKASVSTFTRGGHAYGEEEGISSTGVPQHAMMDDGASFSHGGGVQHGDTSAAAGIRHQPGSQPQNPQVLEAQRALQGNINEGLQTVQNVGKELTTRASLPPLGTDSAALKWKQTTLDVSRSNVSSALAAMLSSTASVITLTGGDPTEINYTAVGSSVTTISTNLSELAKAVRLLAALNPTSPTDDELLKAAQALANATAGLLGAAQPENMENRTQLLNAAGLMGTTGEQVLQRAGVADVDPKVQEALVIMAKDVASATAALVTNARNVAAKCSDQALQNQVILSAKQTALATQSLIACTKVLAPCIYAPLCREQLIESCKMVAAAVEKIVVAAQAACEDEEALRDLGAAATAVTESLRSLVEMIKESVNMMNEGEQYDIAVDAIMSGTERLFASMGNTQEMVKQAKILAEATSSLVNAIKLEAENENDPDARRRLLDAAKSLAEATSKMVEAAKEAARNPQDEAAQEALRKAAEHLRAVTSAAAANALKKRAIKKLEIAAKNTAAVATQCIAAAKGAAGSNRNEASQDQLINHCKAVAEQISSLVTAVRSSITSPENPSAQLGLINASQAMIAPSGKMVAAAKAAVPTVGDQAAALQLGNFAKSTAIALAELRAASARAAEVCGSLEIDSAIARVKELSKEMVAYKQEASSGNLLPLPGESVESCALELGATSKTVGSSMAQLLTAANQGNENYTGIAARDTANALAVLAHAVRGVAAGTNNTQTQGYILSTAQQVMDKSVALISESKVAVQDPSMPNKQHRLAQAAKAVSQALNQVVNCLPGQIEFDHAIKAIAEASRKLQSGKFPSAGGANYQTLQANLSAAAAALNVSGSEVVAAARSNPEVQAETTQKFAQQFEELLTAGLMLAGASKDKESRDEMLGYLRTISVSSSKLLLAAKALSADPNAPNVMTQLAAAARSVTDAINSLLNLCSSSGPGQKECDNAVRSIEAVAPVLDNPNEPVSDLSYFDCLDLVMEKSKVLGEAGSQITTHAKKGEIEDFAKCVDTVANAVCQLTEASAQAAYLVGIADPSSTAAAPGLIDQTQFARASQAISTACQNLLNPAATQQQVLAAATVIAKHTSVLCNACKVASSKTNNPVAKRHFVQAAKEVANGTANLVKNIKALASDLSEENRQACAETTKPLIEAVEALTTFASSPQFASTPAKISAQGRKAQEPILLAGKNINKSSNSLLMAAKNLAMNPNDPPMWQLLASHTKAVTDAIKNLILAIKDKCPGQKECDDSIDILNDNINKLDQAILAVMSQQLKPQASSSLQGYQEQMLECTADIKDSVEPLQSAAKGEAEKLGHRVMAMSNQIPALTGAAIGAASKTASSQMQTSLLEQSKTLVESALQLVYASKEAGGNVKSTASHTKVDEASKLVEQATVDLTATLESAGGMAGLISGMLDDITKSMNMLDETMKDEVVKSYSDFQAEAFNQCKKITTCAQDMILKSSSSPGDLCDCSRTLTTAYRELVECARGAIATLESHDINTRLKNHSSDLGNACKELVQSGASVQGNPNDSPSKRLLADCSRIVAEKVSYVLTDFQAGAVGTQACTDAVQAISGIIADLETTAMFCTAGALPGSGGNFAEHRVKILETAKLLVEDTKRLVNSAGASQESLAEAATKAVKTITSQADYVKSGVGALASQSKDDMESQILLLSSVKDVANALKNLIDATRNASGKSVQDPAMEALKTSAKDMVSQVSSMLKTVKNVEEESGKIVRSLENAIDNIESGISEFESGKMTSSASPEDLIRSTKSITLASAKAVAAGNSCKPADVSACANMSRSAVHDMLLAAVGASNCAEDQDTKDRIISSTKECAEAFKRLLEYVHQLVDKPSSRSPETKHQLAAYSKEVAVAVTEVMNATEAVRADWVDLKDPNVIAETELLQAAASIEAAAKKLSELKPREKAHADEDLNFEEQILEAAKSIAAATSSLVKSASAAQRELVAQGKLSSNPKSEDGQWSEGLVSAAKLVASVTSNLCDAANQVVQGQAQEEKLIAAAKGVASSTAQLLLACQVKADPNSESNRRLQTAGTAVKKATETLVNAARSTQVAVTEERAEMKVKGKVATQFRRELEAQERLVKMQRELEKAKEELYAIRKERSAK